MESDELRLGALSQLATSRDIADRAFAASALALLHGSEDRGEIDAIYESVRETAKREHARLREQIRNGAFNRGHLLEMLQQEPLATRDHLIEEILDVAYPPLGERRLPRDSVPYSPSGLGEILFALEHAELGPGATLVDLGSGLGKVTLLSALLTGADAYGVELDPALVAHANGAAASLGLTRAHFVQGDIRDAPLPLADAYYLFIPLHRSEEVVERLAPIAAERSIVVFSQPLDERRVPFLRASGKSSYWLTMYESIGVATGETRRTRMRR